MIRSIKFATFYESLLIAWRLWWAWFFNPKPIFEKEVYFCFETRPTCSWLCHNQIVIFLFCSSWCILECRSSVGNLETQITQNTSVLIFTPITSSPFVVLRYTDKSYFFHIFKHFPLCFVKKNLLIKHICSCLWG